MRRRSGVGLSETLVHAVPGRRLRGLEGSALLRGGVVRPEAARRQGDQRRVLRSGAGAAAPASVPRRLGEHVESARPDRRVRRGRERRPPHARWSHCFRATRRAPARPAARAVLLSAPSHRGRPTDRAASVAAGSGRRADEGRGLVLVVGSARREARGGGAARERGGGATRAVPLGGASPRAGVRARRPVQRGSADERVPACPPASGDVRVDGTAPSAPAGRRHLGGRLPERLAGHRARVGAGLPGAAGRRFVR